MDGLFAFGVGMSLYNEEEADAYEATEDQLQIFGSRLSKLADEQVSKRNEIEARWLEDIRQYEGQYDPDTAALLASNKHASSAFLNITRPKTNAAESRMVDMLFPTDDRNWGLKNTPVPEIAKSVGNHETSGVYDTEGNPISVSDLATGAIAEAKEKAEAMQTEIDDQLIEAGYGVKAREMLHDGVLLGTGILKGPVVVGRTRKSWQAVADEYGNQVQQLSVIEEHMPDVECVSPWDFFPDMSARKIEEAEFILERHYMTKREIKELLKRPGFIHHEVQELIKSGAKAYQSNDSHLAQLRDISGITKVKDESRFELWEYHGPATKEELMICGCDMEEEDEEGEDLSAEMEAIVWFCGPRVVKAVVNPFDSEERPYSVFCWEDDDSSIFGKGVPYLTRDAQRVANGAWRMTLENSALSVGPQIVIDRKNIEPANRDWSMTSRKIWYKKDPNKSMGDTFASFEVNSHQQELMNIVERAVMFADEETSLPRIAQGEQNPNQVGPGAQTMGGMAMLMNSANVVLRRAIKNFDDSVTTPMIRRFYDWNMQFGDDESIKGDYEVDARGSSALLVKEVQAQSLTALATQFAAHPVFGPMTKAASLYRKTVQAYQVSAEDVVMSDEEIKAAQQQMAKQAQGQATEQGNPNDQMKIKLESQKLQMQYQMHQETLASRQQEREMEIQERMIEREITMAKISAEQGIAIEKINADLVKTRENNDAKWKAQLAETHVKARYGSGL